MGFERSLVDILYPYRLRCQAWYLCNPRLGTRTLVCRVSTKAFGVRRMGIKDRMDVSFVGRRTSGWTKSALALDSSSRGCWSYPSPKLTPRLARQRSSRRYRSRCFRHSRQLLAQGNRHRRLASGHHRHSRLICIPSALSSVTSDA